LFIDFTYFFQNSNPITKETISNLPEEYTIIGGDEDDSYIDEVDNGEYEYPITTEIEGYPDWRRVELEDGKVYYFNVETSSTSWFPPNELEDQQAQTS